MADIAQLLPGSDLADDVPILLRPVVGDGMIWNGAVETLDVADGITDRAGRSEDFLASMLAEQRKVVDDLEFPIPFKALMRWGRPLERSCVRASPAYEERSTAILRHSVRVCIENAILDVVGEVSEVESLTNALDKHTVEVLFDPVDVLRKE